MLGCSGFVFISLLELALVGYMSARDPGPAAAAERKKSRKAAEMFRNSDTVLICAAFSHNAQCVQQTSPTIRRLHAAYGLQRSRSIEHQTLPLNAAAVSMQNEQKKGTRVGQRRHRHGTCAARFVFRSLSLHRRMHDMREARLERMAAGPCCGMDMDMIDKCSAIGFPISFLLFNIFYWGYYTWFIHL
jgi:hypothetical protein